MAALNESLEALAQSLRPDAEEISCLDRAFRRVSSLLMERYPQAKVHLVGSAANDCILGIRNSNCIDVCLDIPDRDHDATFKAVLVGEMGQLAVGAGMASVLPLPSARTPVLKFTIPETGTRVDVFVDARLALANTKLLADYAAIDSRLPKLVSIVKHWAKRRQVNDSYRGTLSSYCYTLMCIHHLQTREAPVLPCLQAINPPRVAGGGSGGPFTVAAPKFESTNTESLADLIWSFFEHFAWGHDYNNSVVSVRSGGLLAKTQKEWTRRLGNERHLICVEDPYDVSHDLGCTVDRQTSGILHREFERAASALKDLEDPLPQLFEPYRAGRAE